MKILIFGGKGQLGHDLVDALAGNEIHAPDHNEVDITKKDRVQEFVTSLCPNTVINVAAFHDVPMCETNPLRAFDVNAVGPQNIAAACKDVDGSFFSISTDYVFDGQKGSPYFEEDTTSPLMVYGASKLAGEHLAFSQCPRTHIIRTIALFGGNPCRAKPGGRNFVEMMLHLARTQKEVKVVGDQYCCPTYTPNLASQIKHMIDNNCPPGVYHATNQPGLSWYDFAKMIFDEKKIQTKLTKVKSDEFPTSFARPLDSRLQNKALEKSNLCLMGTLKNALSDYFINKN